MSVVQLEMHPDPSELEGAEPIYVTQGVTCSLHPPPSNVSPTFKSDGTRTAILEEWGQKRELHMHRQPSWCMDQLVSGSGLYPPRHLTDEWFTKEEMLMIHDLERLLEETNHGKLLAKDMMALRLYNVDIRIIIDDSGSMSASMFGWREPIGQTWDFSHIEQVFGERAFSPDSLGMFMNTGCRLAAGASRWDFLVDAICYWEPIFKIMQTHPVYYTMNRTEVFRSSSEALARGPIGATPSGATFLRVLDDIEREDPKHEKHHLIICLTDGEASDPDLFNNVLDSIQDGAYGDVQVLLMGLSLEPQDIKFFEDEECDDTRIRTIEAYEVEQQMILWRKVIQRPTDYNFAMHSIRALVTNFFPADYDYEAPIQTLRHRLYISLHALDRRITGRRNNTYFDDDLSDCCGLLALFNMSGRRARGSDAEEANLIRVLCDPRFESLMQSLKPPPQKAATSVWGGRAAFRSSDVNPAFGKLRSAIGALQPSETVSRDLQFANVVVNSSAVRRAVTLMCQAIGDPELISGGVPQLTAGPGPGICPDRKGDPLEEPLLNPPRRQDRSLGQSMLCAMLGGAALAVVMMLVISFSQ